MSACEREAIKELSRFCSATLIGSGSDNTEGLLSLVLALLSDEGSTLILDADAINALATIGDEGRLALKSAKRPLILTPHPLEFARLAGFDVAYVQQHRIEVAESFAKEYGVTLVLKGAGTLIAGDGHLAINSTGSSALAKAGSGDVLAGFLGALAAQPIHSLRASALAVAFHAMAGDSLAKEYSSYGVTPSDLPKEIARMLAKAEKEL
jgi:NAD(P)H-hydrate epimerase